MRYRLQRRERYVLPNTLGGTSQPVYTYRWKDIATSDERDLLEIMAGGREDLRVIDVFEVFTEEEVIT